MKKFIVLSFGLLLLLGILSGCNVSVERFFSSTENGDINLVKEYVVQGGDIEIKNEDGLTALQFALNKGQNMVAKLLIETGANADIKDINGNTTLMIASAYSNASMVELLLEKGIEVNSTNNLGDTAFILASKRGNIDIIKILLDKGVDINVVNNDEYTALGYATLGNNEYIVKLLIDNGANSTGTLIKHKDRDNTIINAVSSGNLEIVKLLIKNGADVEVENADGESLLMVASRLNHSSVISILEIEIERLEKEKQAEIKRLEEEKQANIKAIINGFKNIKSTIIPKLEGLKFSFSSIKIGTTYVHDSYGSRYFYNTAERGKKYITMKATITSESNDPILPEVAFYKYEDLKLHPVGSVRYNFTRWQDYGTYLGNYHDTRNDFAYKSSISFSIGGTIEEETLNNNAIFVVLTDQLCYKRVEERFENPAVRYSFTSMSPNCDTSKIYKSLELEDLEDLNVVKIFNRHLIK